MIFSNYLILCIPTYLLRLLNVKNVVVFNASMVVAYLLLIYVFGMPLEDMQDFGKYTVLILLAGGNALMVVVDFCIEKLSVLYKLKWQKRVHQALGQKK